MAQSSSALQLQVPAAVRPYALFRYIAAHKELATQLAMDDPTIYHYKTSLDEVCEW
jgi:hypothetical protein